MNNSIKAWIISVAIATMPLNVKANNSGRDFENQIKTELFTTLWDKNETADLYISPKVVTNAVLNYFDEEVKRFKLSDEARSKIESILNSYFSNHYAFDIDDQWNMTFVIDDKKEFSLMVKNVVNVVIGDMPFLIRKVVIPLFLWRNDAIQEKLDHLDDTLMNMKEKEYKDVIFDYIAWILKRVAISVDWRITLGKYYKDISRYYPNKNGKHILEELNKSGQAELDIKGYKYK